MFSKYIFCLFVVVCSLVMLTKSYIFQKSKIISHIFPTYHPINAYALNNPCIISTRYSSHSLSRGLKMGYKHSECDKKWQDFWEEKQVFVTKRTSPTHPKKYVLDMFPYPSGAGLHVGHPEGYTATDIMARFWRMKGFDVLHPMGWDAFGLPAEQHAINTGTHPSVTTYENIATFKRQLKSLGFSYDWTRELATTDLDYVKWTQWIFLQLFKRGLATQSEVSVNWCPALGTVLANEEVINGLSERGNHPVVRTPLRQWVLKITEYADELEQGLQGMNWPEGTLVAQKQWIGRSEGANILFPLEADPSQTIEVFTTRADTLMGVTYLVLAPEHFLVKKLTSSSQQLEVEAYVHQVSSKSDLERTSQGKDKAKTGVFLGSYAMHPLTNEKIPIWIADYVLVGYGSGAVMAVPAHDERDYSFAKTFQLQIKQVVKMKDEQEDLPIVNEGILINSGNLLDNKSTKDGREAIIQLLTTKQLGNKKISYKLRDWVFSRQRYWGEPIPIYFPVDKQDKSLNDSPITNESNYIIRYDQPIPINESELPLQLPNMIDFKPGNDPQGCLARVKEWRYFQRDDGCWYARETNTMPQWAGSCWYYLRFTDPKNSQELLSLEAKSWLPVDLYVGGQEHAVLHLLYARFWHKVLYDLKVINHPEPFLKLVHQGMILGSDGEKMSKSRGNVINPDDVINEYGADVLRMYEMFMGPLEAVKPWQTSQLSGIVRFRDRVFNLISNQLDNISNDSHNDMSRDIRVEMNKAIKKVTEDIESMSFNTAISTLMVYTNTLISTYSLKEQKVSKESLEILVLLLSPFAPHVAEELWQLLGHSTSLAFHSWPSYDPNFLVLDSRVKYPISINGKVRATIEMNKEASEEQVLQEALQNIVIQKYMSNADIKKVIFVAGKVMNILTTAKV